MAAKDKPILFAGWKVRAIYNGATQTRRPIANKWLRCLCLPDDIEDVIAQAPYQPGDMLWVRETWIGDNNRYHYRATQDVAHWKWKPSIHMPRKAARLFLEVTGVRVQRIQDISREDCHAEGLDEDQLDGGSHCIDGMKSWHVWMMDVWEKAYPGSWQRNDWVWVYDFKRIARA